MKPQPPTSKEGHDSTTKPPSVSISIIGCTSSLKITNPIENGCYLIKVETSETDAELRYDFDRVENALVFSVEFIETQNASKIRVCPLYEGGREAEMMTTDVADFTRRVTFRNKKRSLLKTRLHEYLMMMKIE